MVIPWMEIGSLERLGVIWQIHLESLGFAKRTRTVRILGWIAGLETGMEGAAGV